MKKIFLLSSLALLLAASAHAQLQLVGIGIGETHETQDITASITANVIEPNVAGNFSTLFMDGRDELVVLAQGGSMEFDLAVANPRGIDKKTGNPKYNVVYQVGLGDVCDARYAGNGHWIARVSFADLKAGGFHLTFGLDNVVIGRSRPTIDIIFRIPLKGHDMREDRELIGKLVFIDYKGKLEEPAYVEFLKNRFAEFPVTHRVSWNDLLDAPKPPAPVGGQQGGFGTGGQVGGSVPNGGNVGTGNQPPATPYDAISDRDHKTFAITNNGDDVLEITVSGPDFDTKTVKVKSHATKTFHLDDVRNPEDLSFTIVNTRTGKTLGTEAYTEK